jgi:hypothetical protein
MTQEAETKPVEPDEVETADPFATAQIVPGLEALGKGVLDKYGRPSGSPANWENTAGASDEPLPISEEEAQDEIAKISEQLVIDL